MYNNFVIKKLIKFFFYHINMIKLSNYLIIIVMCAKYIYIYNIHIYIYNIISKIFHLPNSNQTPMCYRLFTSRIMIEWTIV